MKKILIPIITVLIIGTIVGLSTLHLASHHNHGSQITRYPTTTTDYRNDHC